MQQCRNSLNSPAEIFHRKEAFNGPQGRFAEGLPSKDKGKSEHKRAKTMEKAMIEAGQ
ncbi:hypothetical protein [Trichlorobacter lovleyi]|uniref:hypothetical protein n=1 Tax=Trichlorobacter lovleyi TaxID=313985 RepID=UPI002481405C|nr:hypothetical protein [Trichlorobacter lovleyi]